LQHQAETPATPLVPRLERICADHRAIVHALGQRDSELARQSVHRHLQWARACHVQAFDWEQRQQAGSVSAASMDMEHPAQVLEALRKIERDLADPEDNR
jgi:hypothetical protein